MTSPKRSRRALLLLLPCLCGCEQARQQQQLSHARALYYDIGKDGAKGFSCDVQPDWAGFIQSVGGNGSADTPWHRYLGAAHLHFQQPQRGKAVVDWIDPLPVPEPQVEAATQMQNSMKQVMGGFLEAWAPSLSGTMLPSVVTSPFSARAGGYSLTEHDAEGNTTDVSFDSALRITHLSVRGPQFSGEVDTAWQASAKGLLMVNADSKTRSPLSAPEIHSVFNATFVPVDGVQLPASVTVTVDSSTRITFQVSNCTVQR